MKGFRAIGLKAGYGAAPVLEDVSFSAEAGELLGVLGANGSGKTTLLKSICGILPHAGECTLEGVRLEGLSARRIAEKCSYIPQRSGVAIDISALDVVLMGFNARLRLLEQPDSAMRRQALSALAAVGLGGREETNYQHLSEGQKQMCILARTLVTDCRLLLMDEPESALDFRYRYRMLDIVRRRITETGGVGIVSLHDPSLALNSCDKLLLLQGGRCMGVLRPSADPLARMEELLSQIYGSVSLALCRDKRGREHIVMLKEREETP
ncbi:MAG: ABC transporter ATP-binding protein [Eubacteriales bacterium]|nr:ABC transporter ATP-binding protein [Eubacteriales bacterium]